MQTNSIHFPVEIWGELKHLTIPYPKVYFISGTRVQGYAVPEAYAGQVISKKAMACGTAQGGMLYFPMGETMNIIEYELLCHQRKEAQEEVEQLALKEKIKVCEQYGRVDLPKYFGQYSPPNVTPLDIVEEFIRIGNGIYFVRSEDEWLFGICEPIADSELTSIGAAFGRKKMDYLFFDTVTCAIPICELRHTYPEIAALVSSETALYQVLTNHFLSYVFIYNDGVGLESWQLPTEQVEGACTEFLRFPKR
jgi:hypothetical protein